jgi:predicted site-specific integrase-resolvase
MIHIPEGNYLTILEAVERAGAARFPVQKWVEHGLLEVIAIPNLRHLVREDTLSEFLKRDRPRRYPKSKPRRKTP